jgi:tetratricopeptide (TPR) repeat protein
MCNFLLSFSQIYLSFIMGDDNKDVIQSLYYTICNRLKENGQLENTSVAFSKLNTDKERVQFVLNLTSVNQTIKIEPLLNPKSSDGSTSSRVEGNKFFQKKLLRKALEEYTQSIMLAPVSDEKTTALAYANRSAVLFHLRKYELCLRDIKTSVEHRYPDESLYKLLDRKGRCLTLLGEKDEAQSAFEEALKCLTISNLKSKDKHLWKKQLEKQKNQCCDIKEACSSENPLEFIKVGFSDCVTQTHGVNEKFPAASKAFDLAVSPLRGRYPIASQDIQIGDVLLAEKPYASVLLPNHSNTHCHHCLARIIAPLPCSQCVTVRYCSLKCADESWTAYHSVECKNLRHIHSAGKYGHLALRAVLKTGLRQLRDIVSKAEPSVNDYKNIGCNEAGVYNPFEYVPIYHLVGHTEDRVVNDLFRRTVTAVYLLKCIQETSFFNDSPITLSNDKTVDKDSLVLAGGIILRHLQSFPCNAHEISELQLSWKSVATSETIEIGAGIYATLSLFNHSCDPSVTRFFYGDKCVLRALKSITAGQEIADNYGVLCAVTPRDQRRKTLANQYYFNCECQACIEDTPLYSEITKIQKPILRCEDCGCSLNGLTAPVTCRNCDSKQDIALKAKMLKESEEVFSEAVSKLLEEADITSALPQFQSHLCLLEKNVCQPWHGFNSCQELIKQCYNILANCYPVD